MKLRFQFSVDCNGEVFQWLFFLYVSTYKINFFEKNIFFRKKNNTFLITYTLSTYHDKKRRRDGNAGKKSKESGKENNKEKNR